MLRDTLNQISDKLFIQRRRFNKPKWHLKLIWFLFSRQKQNPMLNSYLTFRIIMVTQTTISKKICLFWLSRVSSAFLNLLNFMLNFKYEFYWDLKFWKVNSCCFQFKFLFCSNLDKRVYIFNEWSFYSTSFQQNNKNKS